MRVNTVKKINYIPRLIGSILFSVVAAVFLVLSLTLFKPEIPENYKEVEAVIEKIDSHKVTTWDNEPDDWEYQVYIGYTYNDYTATNKEYSNYNSSMNVGDKVIIYVNEDNPSEFMADNKDFFMFPLLSGLFLALGVGVSIYCIKQLSTIKKEGEY